MFYFRGGGPFPHTPCVPPLSGEVVAKPAEGFAYRLWVKVAKCIVYGQIPRIMSKSETVLMGLQNPQAMRSIAGGAGEQAPPRKK